MFPTITSSRFADPLAVLLVAHGQSIWQTYAGSTSDYVVLGMSVSRDGAQTLCSLMNTNLVRIKNPIEDAFVRTLLGERRGWLGLKAATSGAWNGPFNRSWAWQGATARVGRFSLLH